MKRIIFAALSIILFGSNAYTQESRKQEALFNKALVVYFSATGTTAGAAKKIAQVTFLKHLIRVTISIGETNSRAVRRKWEIRSLARLSKGKKSIFRIMM